MTYTATTGSAFRQKAGTLSQKLATEFAAIDTELDTLTGADTTLTTSVGKAAIKYFDLTGSMVSSSSLAANGVDLAAGTDATYYAVFFAPQAMTIVGMVTLMTEAYVKETTDAKIELKTEADTPVTKVTYTLPQGGRAVKNMVTTTPTSAALAAGDILNLCITATASSSGTGRAKVFLKYTID